MKNFRELLEKYVFSDSEVEKQLLILDLQLHFPYLTVK